MKLTENFSLAELLRSDYGLRHGLDNFPPDSIYPNLKILAEGLERARLVIGKPLRISSGYRSPDINRAVGGSRTSFHMQGLAADIEVDGMTPLEVCTLLDKHRDEVRFDKVILEFFGWSHIQFAPKGDAPRYATYTIKDKRTGYVEGLIA